MVTHHVVGEDTGLIEAALCLLGDGVRPGPEVTRAQGRNHGKGGRDETVEGEPNQLSEGQLH
jgi:hypothetical protein